MWPDELVDIEVLVSTQSIFILDSIFHDEHLYSYQDY
jgi:hypothetical protein